MDTLSADLHEARGQLQQAREQHDEACLALERAEKMAAEAAEQAAEQAAVARAEEQARRWGAEATAARATQAAVTAAEERHVAEMEAAAAKAAEQERTAAERVSRAEAEARQAREALARLIDSQTPPILTGASPRPFVPTAANPLSSPAGLAWWENFGDDYDTRASPLAPTPPDAPNSALKVSAT